MSIENKVEKSIKTFYSSMKENIDYVDLNFRGIVNRTRTFTDDKGNKQSYTEQTVGVEGVACLRDKFRIWLMSDDGDYHRNPGVGGFLVKNVVKRPFIDSNCPVIEALLRAEAEEKTGPMDRQIQTFFSSSGGRVASTRDSAFTKALFSSSFSGYTIANFT